MRFAYAGARLARPVLCKYLYANANPVNGSDPSGHWTLSEIAIVNGVIGGMASSLATVATPSFWKRSAADQISDIASSFVTGFIGGSLGSLVGGPLGSAAGKLFIQTALRPFIQGAFVGATSNMIQQVLQEMIAFINNPEGFRFKDAAGRTVVATFAGFAFGGLLAKFETVVTREGFAIFGKAATFVRLEMRSIQLDGVGIYFGGIKGGAFGNWVINIWNEEWFP